MYGLSKMLGTRNVLDLVVFPQFWNICIYIMRYLGERTQVQTWNLFMFHVHLIYIAWRYFTQHFYWVWACLTNNMKSGVEFSSRGIMSVLRTVQILQWFRFMIFGLGKLNLHIKVTSFLLAYYCYLPLSRMWGAERCCCWDRGLMSQSLYQSWVAPVPRQIPVRTVGAKLPPHPYSSSCSITGASSY
jgi:hypothetical protein